MVDVELQGAINQLADTIDCIARPRHETVGEVIDTFNDEQLIVLYACIDAALNERS